MAGQKEGRTMSEQYTPIYTVFRGGGGGWGGGGGLGGARGIKDSNKTHNELSQ